MLKTKLQTFMSTKLVDFPVVIVPEPEDAVADAAGGGGDGG